ncbi:MAG TPA: hypothetical protein VEO58_07970 [Gemmatimonadales bacterium]|nr:hypothetical protein [Gemmatimonadales bacterium]
MSPLLDTLSLPVPFPRVARAVQARLRQVRAHPVFNPVALEESWRERAGYPVDPDHRPHLMSALDWLLRAQDATGGGGIARGYSLAWNPSFESQGWQPAYPETTGYIIPTLFEAARHLNRPALAVRAERAARWELEIQLPSGAVRGGVIGDKPSPAVFNTGQVLLGWLAAFAETGSGIFAGGARRAACYLLGTLDEDGLWRRGNSRFADPSATLYNARVAWALAEAGRRLGAPEFRAAAARNLRAVARRQHNDGWFPDCCLNDPRRPLLHTIAYTIRGLLEGGRVLEDERLMAAAECAAERVALAVGPAGWLPGRFAAGWRPAASWSCLTGQVQMANIWLRLFAITRERKWLEPVEPVLRFVKSTQNRTSRDPGVRGGIKGSFPLSAEYGSYQILNWATKFFIDALMRDERRHADVEPAGATDVLA